MITEKQYEDALDCIEAHEWKFGSIDFDTYCNARRIVEEYQKKVKNEN
jgi:hypothetical protein